MLLYLYKYIYIKKTIYIHIYTYICLSSWQTNKYFSLWEAKTRPPEVAQKRQYMNCAVVFKARRSRGVPVLKNHLNDKFHDALMKKL